MIEIKRANNNFEKVMAKYIVLSNKLPADVANKTAKDVAIQAVKHTKFATNEEIATDLNQPSRVNPQVSVATILAAIDGTMDDRALIKKRQGHKSVCRLGFVKSANGIPAKGGFVPRLRDPGNLGGAQPAVVNSNHIATATTQDDVLT